MTAVGGGSLCILSGGEHASSIISLEKRAATEMDPAVEVDVLCVLLSSTLRTRRCDHWYPHSSGGVCRGGAPDQQQQRTWERLLSRHEPEKACASER